jgi:murein DD-endopeptidase MepM/ murein hydrolase activator NlpD
MHRSRVVSFKQYVLHSVIMFTGSMIALCSLSVHALQQSTQDRAVELYQETPTQETPTQVRSIKKLNVYKLRQILLNMQLKRIKCYLNVPILGKMNLSSNFGMRQDPVHGEVKKHSGVDLSSPSGTPILAVASGRVVSAGWHHAYGLNIEIEHGPAWRSRYAHAKLLYVKIGQTVESGQFIGQVGSTGRSTGPHLHFEIWQNGQPIDPYLVVKGLPVRHKRYEASWPAVHYEVR